ncbi:endonuclease I family protein [Virgibacillus flavescens]|uniref:endonuclease I family protein n=1 Tax=Virgibacillus flavescens TaxID=1611422 RepID=UPI003D33F68C
MNLSDQQAKLIFPVTTNKEQVNTILQRLDDAKSSIQNDHKEYFDEDMNKRTIISYYHNIDFKNFNQEELTQLLSETHTNQLSYNPSEYVYPWVDLRPDGNLISIYSGKQRNPEDIIKEDYVTSLRRKDEVDKREYIDEKQLKEIESNFKYNCEHAVPQSWFNEKEPMRGDLHHLFTCDPLCNSIRSNYPYHDFAKYNAGGISANRVEEGCGIAEEELFEPEYGKGTVARAMLYFLLRYPMEIEKTHIDKIEKSVLIEWHKQFPPAIYENHRNQAIYQIQGNRNPFIDFPNKIVDC